MTQLLICSSCGAENEFVFNACIFCKTPVAIHNQEVLSNEQLVEKVAEWVDKSRELHIEINNHRHSGKHNSNIPLKIDLTNSEIRACARKYLTILSSRLDQSPELSHIYHELSHRFDMNISLPIRGHVGYTAKSSNTIFVWLLVAIVLFAIVFFSLYGDGEKNQMNKIERLNREISTLIETKQYTKAMSKADELVWTYVPELHHKQTKALNIQREIVKETITELMEKDK